MYFNANNVYGWAISRKFGFKWMTDEKTENFYVCETSNTSKYRSILEDELEYPEHFMKMHYNQPLAMQEMYIIGNMLGLFCNKFFIYPLNKKKKLMPIYITKSMQFAIETWGCI